MIEEALPGNGEYRSTNAELLTSKAALQSLNAELTALNGQLEETLERSRTTSNDLQNVLYSTEVATLFLDRQLRIRLFTPATLAVFSMLPGDVGRPLADLRPMAEDATLIEDAAAVLAGGAPRLQEIRTRAGLWFSRRVMPYRAQDGGTEGVVITFADITERRRSDEALQVAMQLAEQASVAKSRFLGAASHDLRQPLQTMTLLQGLLARHIKEGEAVALVALLKPTIGAMAGVLNTLLDIDQIDSGALRPRPVDVDLAPLLARLATEFSYVAEAQGLELRMVPCSLGVHSDAEMLEQILRNLLANALKYTRTGRVLLGCRRHGTRLSIEVWDTGIGIPAHELSAIFEEYRQLDNTARERAKGLGLGLSIAQRFAAALGHRLTVRSKRGGGSVFTVELGLADLPALAAPPGQSTSQPKPGSILVVEDDPDVQALLVRLLQGEGHNVLAAADGEAAMALLATATARPELLLTDYNLPGRFDGAHLAIALRERLSATLPVIILSADITAEALREIARLDCVHLHKPVRPDDLLTEIRRLLRQRPGRPRSAVSRAPTDGPVLQLVDDDAALRGVLRRVLEQAGHRVIDHASAEAFLAAYHPGDEACLLLDAHLPGLSGLALLEQLRRGGDPVPAIVITGFSDVPAAVAAMRAGASDFIEKPVQSRVLLDCVARALERAHDLGKLAAWQDKATLLIERLTPRQQIVMDRVLAGEPSKNIAADLGISQRTVETHRAAIMHRTGAASLPALARLALAAKRPVATA